MKTQLFIENQEVELTDDVQFLLNKQFEDVTEPTTIINDWSKTVSIPFSEANNRLFGYIYRPDRIILGNGNADSYKLMNMYFDPTKKLDFKLVYNTFLMMSGYAKMNEIKQTDGKGVYNITLYGQLGKIFQEMKKITFDESTPDTNYLIDGSEYVEEKISKDIIYASWTSNSQISQSLKHKTDNDYRMTDIIGFAPNNAFTEGFDYTTFQTATAQSELFTEWIENNVQFKENTGISLDTILPNGFLPREWAEYRSYLQLPFIYFNKLFQIFQAKAEEITDYKFELDSNWFNTSNPYWYNLVYMLKPFDIKLGNDYFNQFMANCNLTNEARNDINWFTYRSAAQGGPIDNTDNTYTYLLTNVRNTTGNAGLYDSTNNTMIIKDDVYNLVFKLNPVLRNVYGNANAAEYYQDKTTLYLPIVFDLIINGSNGYVETKRAVIINDNAPQQVQDIKDTADVIIKENGNPHFATYTTTREWKWNIKYPDIQVTNEKFGNSISIKVETYFYKNNLNAFPIAIQGVVAKNTLAALIGYVYDDTTVYNYNNISKARFHSGNTFTLNDLWNKEFNIFDEIIRYCKMYRIGIISNDVAKKIIFKPFNRYFTNYTITDWTDKVDKSKDFVIKPLTFESKYVIFNYDDTDVQIGKEYKEKFSLNYGSYRLVTDYNFDTSSKDLFSKIKPSIVSTDNVLNFYWLTRNRVTYSFPAEIFVSNKDKDKKAVSLFGTYFFHNGLANFELNTDLHMKDPFISDDTEWQDFNNTFMYNSGSSMGGQVVNTYPKLDIVNGNNLCVFNVPKENYTYLNNYSDKNSIYYNFWEKYINERYNIQNKIITCYITFTPEMWNNFSYSNFIKIDNQICFVNKIYDYDITSVEPTKIDLITIQDFSGYASNNYV